MIRLNQDVISATQKIVEDNMLPPKEYEIEDLSQYIEGTNKYLQSNMDYYHNIYHILTEMENQMKKTA